MFLFFNFLTARQSRFDNWKNETEKFESEAKKKQKLYLKNIQDFESHQAKNRDEALEQFKKEQEHIVVHAKENSKKRVLDTLKLLRDQEENLALNLKAEEEKIAQLIYKKNGFRRFLMQSLFFPFLNFFVLLIFLWIKAKPFVKNFVFDRSQQIENQVHEFQKQLQSAKNFFEDMSIKEQKFETKIIEIQNTFLLELQKLKQELLKKYELEAKAIEKNTNYNIESIYREFQGQSYVRLKNKVFHTALDWLVEKEKAHEKLGDLSIFVGQVKKPDHFSDLFFWRY